MGLFPRREGSDRDGEGHDPLELVRRAQGGDRQAREDLIRSYKPFVMRVTAESCGRYVVAGEDEETSIALLAFDEAITAYRGDRGGSFLKFAETVIKRRLIDYFRKQNTRREVPLTAFEVEDEEGEVYAPAEEQAAVLAHQDRVERADRAEEIMRYQRALAAYGITFAELAALSPKHQDARDGAKRLARALAANAAWIAHLERHRSLPLQELERSGLGVSRKTVERNRKYIIAVAILLIGDYDHLKSYVACE